MKVRFYMSENDYTGTVVDVERIMFIDGKRTVISASGTVFDCPQYFVIENSILVNCNNITGAVVIKGA